jgi:nitroreductase
MSETAPEMGVFETIYHCRAMRRLKPDPVPEALLIRLIDAGNQAPSGSNQQPARWLIVRDPEQRRRIAEINRAAVQKYLTANANRSLLPHQNAEAQQRIARAVVWETEHLHEIPALIFACRESSAPVPETFHAGFAIAGSVWPAVQNVLLAARALGLGAAPTTLVTSDRAALKAALALPETIEPVCMIPVGYPLGKFGPVTRMAPEQTLRWDRWA